LKSNGDKGMMKREQLDLEAHRSRFVGPAIIYRRQLAAE
jgi:hypothetical protein